VWKFKNRPTLDGPLSGEVKKGEKKGLLKKRNWGIDFAPGNNSITDMATMARGAYGQLSTQSIRGRGRLRVGNTPGCGHLLGYKRGKKTLGPREKKDPDSLSENPGGGLRRKIGPTTYLPEVTKKTNPPYVGGGGCVGGGCVHYVQANTVVPRVNYCGGKK